MTDRLTLVNIDNVAALKARVEAMQSALKLAAVQFRFYRDQHEAKGTESSLVKAKINEQFSAMCERVADGGESPVTLVCENYTSYSCMDNQEVGGAYMDCRRHDCPMKALGVGK